MRLYQNFQFGFSDLGFRGAAVWFRASAGQNFGKNLTGTLIQKNVFHFLLWPVGCAKPLFLRAKRQWTQCEIFQVLRHPNAARLGQFLVVNSELELQAHAFAKGSVANWA